jgi:pyruvate/2-oxoglutarate/acetoin dehydrogenase E1 component
MRRKTRSCPSRPIWKGEAMSERRTYVQAIQETTSRLMAADSRVHMLGLGVTYPNGADGTTGGLMEAYPGRVHDVPCSENAVTGMAVGMAVSGLRPIVHHGRLEFALYAMDPLLTQAANWNYMFGGDYPCPLTVRIALGRQWGNGPQHTRISRALFAVPGLKVVCPSTPAMAAQLLLAAVRDDNPVIYFEHRWLYKLWQQPTPSWLEGRALDKAAVLRAGTDLTIVAVGDMVIEALRAAQRLQKDYGLSAEVIDLVSIYPMDRATVQASVNKTRRLVAIDSAPPSYNCASELMGQIVFDQAIGISCPDVPCPTSTALTKMYYPTECSIVSAVAAMLRIQGPEGEDRSFRELNLPPPWNVDELLAGRS